jgi:hypothetical protein
LAALAALKNRCHFNRTRIISGLILTALQDVDFPVMSNPLLIFGNSWWKRSPANAMFLNRDETLTLFIIPIFNVQEA